ARSRAGAALEGRRRRGHVGRDWLERIGTQVSTPVRWDQCMHTMSGLGASALIELPPGGTLTGLARRALPEVARAAVKTPEDLDAARSLLAEHGAPVTPEDGHVPQRRQPDLPPLA